MQSFGPLEGAIMDLMWATGRAMTGREVLEHLERDPRPAYTTVTTVMDILCRKGFLHRERVGRAYRYAPAASRETYSAELMGQALLASQNQQATLLEFVAQLGDDDAAVLRAAIDQARATTPPAGTPPTGTTPAVTTPSAAPLDEPGGGGDAGRSSR